MFALKKSFKTFSNLLFTKLHASKSTLAIPTIFSNLQNDKVGMEGNILRENLRNVRHAIEKENLALLTEK